MGLFKSINYVHPLLDLPVFEKSIKCGFFKDEINRVYFIIFMLWLLIFH